MFPKCFPKNSRLQDFFFFFKDIKFRIHFNYQFVSVKTQIAIRMEILCLFHIYVLKKLLGYVSIMKLSQTLIFSVQTPILFMLHLDSSVNFTLGHQTRSHSVNNFRNYGYLKLWTSIVKFVIIPFLTEQDIPIFLYSIVQQYTKVWLYSRFIFKVF